jgi:MoaD family protein
LKVTVEYLGHVRNLTDHKRQEQIEIPENSTIADLLTKLTKKYGDPFKKAIYETGQKDLKPNYIATINGYLLNQLNGTQTKLKNTDHITLMPVVSGG